MLNNDVTKMTNSFQTTVLIMVLVDLAVEKFFLTQNTSRPITHRSVRIGEVNAARRVQFKVYYTQ